MHAAAKGPMGFAGARADRHSFAQHLTQHICVGVKARIESMRVRRRKLQSRLCRGKRAHSVSHFLRSSLERSDDTSAITAATRALLHALLLLHTLLLLLLRTLLHTLSHTLLLRTLLLLRTGQCCPAVAETHRARSAQSREMLPAAASGSGGKAESVHFGRLIRR